MFSALLFHMEIQPDLLKWTIAKIKHVAFVSRVKPVQLTFLRLLIKKKELLKSVAFISLNFEITMVLSQKLPDQF